MREAIAAFWATIHELCLTVKAAAKGTRNLADYYEETTGSFVENERTLRAQRLAASKPE